ncbi:MAG: prephenate dehydratase [Eubacterium sp.]|nr:prephenate dehydratase [Eubacterium sp.]
MKELTEIRKELDIVDRQIVELYKQRMELSDEVAAYKQQSGKPVYDKEREEEKLNTVVSLLEEDGLRKNGLNKDGLRQDALNGNSLKQGIRELFEQIMSISRKRQYQILNLARTDVTDRSLWVEKLPVSGRKVVFQGTDGAYSQVAMKEFFQDRCESFHVKTWRDAMETLVNNEADYAVLPIENTTAGIVSENYDLIAEYNHFIVGELVIKVDHALLGVKGASLNDITSVLSHPQALAQCSRFLEQNRNWKKVSMENTAVSARKVKEENKKSQAAIANRLTADIYGLDILAEKIVNVDTNETRFIIVSAKETYVENGDKISICFELPHESGSLYHILSHFIFNNLNMTKIESRPIPGRNWEYRFFADFDGNLQDFAVKNALTGIRNEARNFKLLGNYKQYEKRNGRG